MATLSNSQRLKDARKKREEENKNSSSQSASGSYRNSEKLEKRSLERSIGVDTFESDITDLGTIIGNIYSEWQDADTMKNTRNSVESMQKRINAMQTYQSKYGSLGFNVENLANGYQSVLDDWDNLSSTYGYYQNADAFNTARKKTQMDEQFSGLSYDEVQKKLGEYEEGSDEYNYLSNYTNYSDLRDYDKAIEALKNANGKTSINKLYADNQIEKFSNQFVQNPGTEKANSNLIQSQMDKFKVSDKKADAPKVVNGGAIEFNKKLTPEQKTHLDELQTARNQYALDNAFDLYRDYMEAEDFEETSQYVSTKSDKWHAGLTSQYGLGYEDLTYEYINNQNGIREEIEHKASIFGKDTGDGTSSMEKHGYDKLNEDEVKVYNTIYATEGKEAAQKFLDAMEVTLTKRVYDEQTQRWEDIADSGAVASTIMSALSVPANIMGAIGGTAESIGDAIQGKEYNPYGYWKSPSNFSADTREYVGENIAESTEGWELFGQNIPQFLYQTGMSVADTAIGSQMFGGGFSVVMGLSSAQQKAKDLKEAGASSAEIAMGAVASGAFEMIFEKVSLDNLIKSKNVDSLGRIVKETLKQAGIEGSEEIATEFSNILFDTVSRGKDSDAYKMYEEYLERGFTEGEARAKVAADLGGQIAWAGVGGILSGTAMGGTSTTAQYVENKGIGEQIRSNDRVNETIEAVKLTDKESEAYQAYEAYFNKGINAENIKNAQLGNLYNTTANEAYRNLHSRKTTAEQKADAISTMKNLEVVETSKPETERKRQQRVRDLAKGEETKVGEETARIEGVKIEDGATTLLTSQGEVKAEDMTFSANDAEIVSYAEIMDNDKANLFISQYDGKVDVQDYVNSFNLAYSYGEAGIGADNALRNKGVLSETQMAEIYKSAVTAKASAKQKAIDEINAKYSSKNVVAGKFDDSIIDYNSKNTDGSKVNWKSLTSTQRRAVTFAKAFSKATGVNIKFVKSDVVDGKHKGKNGSYNADSNTIEIDVYAGRVDAKALNDSIIPTLAHEMTHWMKAKAPEMFSKMQENIMNTLAMHDGEDADARINAEIARLKKNHPEMDVKPEDAVDEIVARACEDMLSNSKTARELLEGLSESEKKTFVDKVKELYQNLIDWVNDLLGEYESESDEAKILRQYEDKLKESSKMWDEALAEAVKTNQNLQKEGTTAEKVVGENTFTETTAQLSMRTYENEGRELLHKWLNNSDLDAKTRKDIIEQMDYVYEIASKYAEDNDLIDFSSWSETDVVRRNDGTPILTVVVPNGDYPLNIDFSQICKKRKALNAVLNALVRSGDLDARTLSQSDIGNINRIIKKHGFEIACALCFVDSKRYRVNEWADSFTDTYNKLVTSLAKGTDFKVDEFNYTGRKLKQPEGKLLKDADDAELNFDYINEVLAKNASGKAIYRYALAIKNNKALRSKLNSSEIISSAGLDAIKVQNELLYGLVNSHQGSAKPKLSHSENPYGYEILLDSRFNVEDAYKVGGVRIQSFSDYMANMFFDYVQMIGDLSAKQLPAHAYTKEYYFAKLFGLTGIKINLSIVPKGADITDEQKARFNKMTKAAKEKDAEFKALKAHAGLDAEGNYILEDETFPLDKALELQNTDGYDKNCGIIWVGVSNKHIEKMLDDDNVPFIIPYHKSSLNPAIARMRNIDFYNDYTKAQNTRYDTKAKKKVPSSVWSFDFYADLAKTNDPRQTAENYKAECRERGYLPKFDDFMDHPNYYKLLVDFRVYDKAGNYAPQGAVKMAFPDDFNEIVGESLADAQDTQNKLDADMKGLLDEIRKELKIGKEQYSDRDYMDAVKRGDMETAQKMVDEAAKKVGVIVNQNGNPINLYHGTASFGFTKFNDGLIFATNDSSISAGYTKNKGWGRKRKISESYLDDDGKLETLIKNAKNVLNIDIHRIALSEQKAIRETFREQSKELAKVADDAWTTEAVDTLSVSDDLANDIAWVLSLPGSISENIDDFGAFISSAELESWIDHFDQSLPRLREYLSEKRSELKNSPAWDLYKLVMGYDLSDFAIDARYKLLRSLDDSNLVSESGGIVSEDNTRSMIEAEKDIGSYSLYGIPGNNPLVIDGNGAMWTNIKVDELGGTFSTDKIGEVAKAKGYTSVTIRNIYDMSMNEYAVNKRSDVYIFFDSNQLKSADPVTYDDNGNVIPLSERFNEKNADIRYSDREIDSWLDGLSIDDLIAELGFDDFDITDTKEKVKVERRVDEVNKRLKQIGLSFNGAKSLAWTDERIDTYLGGGYYGSSNPKYAQAYITYMTPKQFLNLTMGGKTTTVDMIQNESASYGELDIEKLGGSSPMFLEIDEGRVWSKVVGHEGRHRMYLLGKAGFERVPVLLFDYKTKYDKTPKDEMKLIAQRYNDTDLISRSRNTAIGEVIPFSQGNKDLIKQKFGSGMEADIHYSDRDTDYIDSRTLLSNALESVAQTDAEKELLTEYRNKIDIIGMKESELAEITAKLNELPRNSQNKEERESLVQKAEKLRNSINYYDKKLLALEATAPLKAVISRERAKARKKSVTSYKEQLEKKAKIESITQKALTLNKWMLKNSKDEHIPEAMKPIVAKLLQAIDFSSKRLLKGGEPTKADISLSQALADVQRMMTSGEVDGEILYELYGADMNEEMAKLVDKVNGYARTVGDNAYVLNQMTLEELQTMDKLVGAVKASVTKMNQFHVVNHKKGIASLSQGTITHFNDLGQAKLHNNKLVKSMLQMINWGNINPFYAFKRFGEGGVKVFEALQEGWDKFAFNVKKIIDYAESVYSADDVKAWSDEVHDFEVLLPATDAEKADPNFKGNKQKIHLTTAQIMSLYCLQKREQAKGHILGGGIRINDIKTKNGVISQSDGVMITEKELAKIVSTLTKEQQEVADALQKFMNEDCTVWGNEISMARFGYKAFTEENYFPIKSDENITNDGEVKEKEKSLYRLLNMSFTKALVEKANNRIVVDNIFDVFAQHTSEMAKYNALALPVLDAVRWFNYKEKGEKVDTHFKTHSVKQAMEKAFGRDAKNYVNTFLQDLNGAENVGRDGIANTFFSNAKIASVALNLKVAVLQPTSYFRASAVIDHKYLMKPYSPKDVKEGVELAKKWCGMALWKSLGFYDTNIQRGVAELIKHDKSFKDKVTEKSMKGAEMMDKFTWGCLWNACESEIKDTRKDLKVGSDEYYTAVGKRLREVIYTTQVVDSTMTRSHMMRSGDKFDKVLTNFASEPTLAYNMLMDVFSDWKLTERKYGKSEAFSKHKGKMVRVAMAYTVTNLATSLLETAFEAYRDDDEEEEDLAEYVVSFLQSFGSNMGITTKIPYVKDLISIIQGFTTNRTDTQWMQNLMYASRDWLKIFKGEGNVYKAIYRTASTISQLSGVALGNAMREFASAWNLTVGNVYPSLKFTK